MSDNKTSPQLWASVTIAAAIITCLGTIIVAVIAKIPVSSLPVSTEINLNTPDVNAPVMAIQQTSIAPLQTPTFLIVEPSIYPTNMLYPTQEQPPYIPPQPVITIIVVAPTSTAVPPTAVPPTITPQTSTFITVHGNQVWQNTGVYVPFGYRIEIVYLSGEWTTNYRNVNGSEPYVDANGYSTTGAYGLPYGAMLGKFDNNQPFLVGNYVNTTSSGGVLYLQINDGDCGDCTQPLGDDDGSINIKITVSP